MLSQKKRTEFWKAKVWKTRESKWNVLFAIAQRNAYRLNQSMLDAIVLNVQNAVQLLTVGLTNKKL